MYERQARNFLNALKNEQPVLCSLDDALHSLQLNLAALQSAADRLPIHIC
jgi:predicted dehydrogenase